MKTIILFILAGTGFLNAQHLIPFASTNNRIELSIANTSVLDAGNVTVEVINSPQWMSITNTKLQITNLKSNEMSTAQFSFSVDKSAPIGKEQKLEFVIASQTGEQWKKEIVIQVSPPEKFELFQNYPNPFNPSTVITYQLPKNNHVTLKVYDAIGREVATLVNEMQEAGFYQQEWRGTNSASGVYFYQIAVKNEKGTIEFFRKKMLLIK